MRGERVCALLLLLSVPTSAPRAQTLGDFAGTLAAGVEGFGQGIGQAITAGPSVFVTATGRVELPAPLTDAYLINIEGRSASAVEAQRLRDQRLQAARSAAARYGVSVEVGSTAFSREADAAAQRRRLAQVQAERLAHPGTPFVAPTVEDTEKVFVARTGVRFRAADPARLPAFLDALKDAGIDSPSGGLGPAVRAGLLGQATEVLGFGALDPIDPTLWDRASQQAVALARRQADVLAAASGRKLGEARQILLLTRSLQGSAASVTVGVRFALLDAPR